jgi:hypothetical protein
MFPHVFEQVRNIFHSLKNLQGIFDQSGDRKGLLSASSCAVVSKDNDPRTGKAGKAARSSKVKKGNRIPGQNGMFEIPLPRSIRYIVIPVWVLTLLYPAYMVLTNASLEKLAYSFFPFIGIGLLLYLIIRLQCPKEILTTKEGAWVIYRGTRETMIPWNGMVFVPRKRSLAYGFEDLVGISIEGHKIAYAEVSLAVADGLKKMQAQFRSGVSPLK